MRQVLVNPSAAPSLLLDSTGPRARPTSARTQTGNYLGAICLAEEERLKTVDKHCRLLGDSSASKLPNAVWLEKLLWVALRGVQHRGRGQGEMHP